jgi:uncharacterized membrane protein YhhN
MAVLVVLGAILAAAAIMADRRGDRRAAYILRPATMLAAIALAALRPPAVSGAYKGLILAGLAAALVGDGFMMLGGKRFLEGLTGFLVAQICYGTAFATAAKPSLDPGVALPLLVYAALMMRLLGPHLGKLKAPVVFYIIVVTLMAMLAVSRFVEAGGAPAFRACLGALLFVASDSLLAVNRFLKAIPAAQVMILSMYYASQILLALSV